MLIDFTKLNKNPERITCSIFKNMFSFFIEFLYRSICLAVIFLIVYSCSHNNVRRITSCNRGIKRSVYSYCGLGYSFFENLEFLIQKIFFFFNEYKNI